MFKDFKQSPAKLNFKHKAAYRKPQTIRLFIKQCKRLKYVQAKERM